MQGLKTSFSRWEALMFLVTMILVTYVFSTAAATYRYFGIDYDPDPAVASLDAAGLPASARSLEIRSSDGERLVAWHVPVDGAPLVIYFHGDGGNLSEALDRVRGIIDGGFSLLALEYRGYGGSTGAADEAGLYIDAEAAYQKAITLGYAPDRIALIGESYGAGVALHLASRREVAAIVVEGSYASASDLLADRFWGFPVRLIMYNRARSDWIIQKVLAPLLMVHGERDDLVPIKYALKLFAHANEPRTFLGVPGEGHLASREPHVTRRISEWLWAQFTARQSRTPR